MLEFDLILPGLEFELETNETGTATIGRNTQVHAKWGFATEQLPNTATDRARANSQAVLS